MTCVLHGDCAAGHQVTLATVATAPKVAATGDDNFIVKLTKSTSGALSVQDAQSNTASAVAGPLTAGKLTIFVIDKVLMSGEPCQGCWVAASHCCLPGCCLIAALLPHSRPVPCPACVTWRPGSH